VKSASSTFHDCCSGNGCTIGHRVVRKKLCCVLFAFIFIIISSISIFLCCLIKLSLSQPMSFTFCPFSSPSQWKGKRGVSERLSAPSFQLPATTTQTFLVFISSLNRLARISSLEHLMIPTLFPTTDSLACLYILNHSNQTWNRTLSGKQSLTTNSLKAATVIISVTSN